MKSKAYWEKRSAEELIDLLKNSDEVIKELKFVYDKSIFNINTSIEKLYGKFAKDNQVSMNAAMRLIQGDEYKQWRMSMEDYLKRIEEGDEPLQLELNVLAMRSRINRLECLQAEIIANATILAQEQEKTATKHLMNAFENSYYHTMYDFYKDKNLKALELMQKHDVAISKEAIKKILEIPWSGSNYSKRIWKRQFNIANKVKELVARNIIEGKSVESLTREVTKEFGQDYRNALKTLIHTETAFVKSQADKEVYTKLNIKEYEFVATLDTKTSEVCRKLDGKHFKVDEATPGKNYPPMHPRCRSLTIRYKPENYEKNTRTARDKDGNNIEVPLGMKYDEWHKKYIKNGEKGYNKDKDKPSVESLKEKIELFDFTKATKDDIVGLGKDLNEIHSIKEKLGEKESLKEIFSNYRDMGGEINKDTWAKGSNKKVKKQIEEAMAFYPQSWAEQLNSNKKLLTVKSKRGFFCKGSVTGSARIKTIEGVNFEDCITIATDTVRKTTPFHELGHMMEVLNPEILRIEKEFIEKRTKDEKEVLLKQLFPFSGYSSRERTKADDFISPYIGKHYEDATEVLSVGLESLFEPGNGQVKKYEDWKPIFKKISDDEEYLNLILGILLVG